MDRERFVVAPIVFPGWLRKTLLVICTLILCACRGPYTASHDPFQQRDERTVVNAQQDGSFLVSDREQAAPIDQPGPIFIEDSGLEESTRSPNSSNQPVVLASATSPVEEDVADTVPTVEPVVHHRTLGKRFGNAAVRHPQLGSESTWGCGCQSCAGPQYKLPPSDEVLCDGGDDGLPARVLADGGLVGLEYEDTVAHYRTPDGKTMLVPTNEVCIYAPRFGSVRQVAGIATNLGRRGPEGIATELALSETELLQEVSTALDSRQPLAGIADKPSSLLRGRQQGGGLENEQNIIFATGRERPLRELEKLGPIQVGSRDQALVLAGMLNAIQWTHDLGVQIIIDRRKAQVMDSDRSAAILYRIEEAEDPLLRIVKLADRATAQPGDTVKFELKYENVGKRPLTDLTIVDNLTTRLAYKEGTQRSDRAADFESEMNDAGSLILKWTVKQPVEPGESGTIQFECTVR